MVKRMTGKTLFLSKIFIFFMVVSIFGCTEKSFTGSVVDPKGNPIENVSVKIYKSNVESKTDGNGNYTIRYRPGTFKVIFSKPKYATYELILNKDLVPDENIILYPLRDYRRVYDFKKAQFEILSPKEEYYLFEKIAQLKLMRAYMLQIAIEMGKSIYNVPSEDDETSDKPVNKEFQSYVTQLQKYPEIEIGKIFSVTRSNNVTVVKLAIASNDESGQFPETLTLVNDKTRGHEWQIKE